MEEHVLDLGRDQFSPSIEIKKEKEDVNPYDIFRLAKFVLIAAAIIYILLAGVRMFYSGNDANREGIKEVWDYSKTFLNSIVSLVLGLYFGTRQGRMSRTN